VKLHWRSPALRAVVIVLLTALAPLLVVTVATFWDFGGSSRLLLRLDEVADVVESELEAAVLAEWKGIVQARAKAHRMRVRVLNRNASTLLDADHQESSVLRRVQEPLGLATSVREFDRSLGPIVARPEYEQLIEVGWAADCRTTARGEHLVCHALRDLDGGSTLYLQDNAPLSVRELMADRSLLARLTVLVLPIALVLAIWLAWRILVPIEDLRRRLLAQAAAAAPGALPSRLPERGDELGDLASAFNVLLDRLALREATHEAFVADLAHEFKSPVAAVKAAAERLEAGDVTPARAARLAGILAGSSRRLEALLDQLLAIARAEAGFRGEDREPVDVGEMLEGIAAAQRLKDPATPIVVTVDGAPSILAVPARIESVLRNLVENAASFGAGAPVTVSADEAVAITVADAGPGIPPEDLARIFDRFFTTRPGAAGTGLGLALAKAVVEAHGGTIRAEGGSEGAVFRLLLPARRRLP